MFQEVQDTSSDMEQSNAVKDTDLMTLPDGVIASTDEDSGDLKNDVEDDDVTVGGESDHDTVEEFLEDVKKPRIFFYTFILFQMSRMLKLQ